MYTQKHVMKDMASTTFTIRVDSAVKKRLEKLAKSTGRSRSYLAAQALSEYLVVNDEIDAAVDRLRAIVLAERARVSAMQATAEEILETFRR